VLSCLLISELKLSGIKAFIGLDKNLTSCIHEKEQPFFLQIWYKTLLDTCGLINLSVRRKKVFKRFNNSDYPQ